MHLACQKPGNDIVLPVGLIPEPDPATLESVVAEATKSVASGPDDAASGAASASHGAVDVQPMLAPLSQVPASALPAPVLSANVPLSLRQWIFFDTTLRQWVIRVPVSRFNARLLAWILVGLTVVTSISRQTVARWLRQDKLKPWRFRTWITPKDLETFLPRACNVLDLYSRVGRGELESDEVVISADEKVSIQARQHASYRPTGAGEPAHIEATYARRGAVGLIAGLNVATGKVYGEIHETRGFNAFSSFVKNTIDHWIGAGKRTIRLILDNGSAHRPKYLATWVEETYPKTTFPDLNVHIHWLPVRSSWLNQIEIVFSFVQAHALTPNNFANTAEVTKRVLDFLDLYNTLYPAFNWTYTSNDLCTKHKAVRASVAAIDTAPIVRQQPAHQGTVKRLAA